VNKKPSYQELANRIVDLESELERCKELEQELEDDRYYLAQAQEIGKIGTWENDLVEGTVRWTPEVYRLTGIEPGTELSGERSMDFIHPDDRDLARKNLNAAMNGEPYDIELRIIVNGKIHWLRNVARMVYDDSGKLIKMIGITQDITFRKEAEQKLKEAKLKLENERYYLAQAQEIGHMGTWEHDLINDVVRWTPEVYRMWGVEPGAELSNERTLSIIHPDDREFAMDTLTDAYDNGKNYDMELRIVVNGEIRWNRNKSKLIFDDDGQVIKAIGISQDITYLKEAEQKIKDAKITDEENRYLHREIHRLTGNTIIGDSFGLKEVMEKATIASRVDSPVLLQGETGVGKDVIANAIHFSSDRRNGPFIKVNCGAIPETLIDSELFGYEKGAFTGALKTRKGKFERAHKGTIFLDEIGELPPQAQTRLLRVVQEKIIERVGGDEAITLDIRIIAATNRILEDMVGSGEFREDLWYRLNVFPMDIPPLRDRTIDIPALTQFFLEVKAKELKLKAVPQIEFGALDRFAGYHWPGNVRELQNIIEREIIINPEGPIDFSSSRVGTNQSSSDSTQNNRSKSFQSLDGVLVNHIRTALGKCEGKIHGPDGAAKLLGMNPSTLRSKIRKLSSDFDF